jgi:hypothetical protein
MAYTFRPFGRKTAAYFGGVPASIQLVYATEPPGPETPLGMAAVAKPQAVWESMARSAVQSTADHGGVGLGVIPGGVAEGCCSP